MIKDQPAIRVRPVTRVKLEIREMSVTKEKLEIRV